MENQELMRYLKDAIEQETSIVEQEKMVEQVTAHAQRQKPQLIVKKDNRHAPQLTKISYVNPLLILALGIGGALLLIGGLYLLGSNSSIDHYSHMVRNYTASLWQDDLDAAYQGRSNALTILLLSVPCFGAAVFSAWTTYQKNQ